MCDEWKGQLTEDGRLVLDVSDSFNLRPSTFSTFYSMIQIKRAYDEPDDDDGCRVLVDGLWPRGVSKEQLKHDEWLKEIAPADELRKWFDHDPDKFEEFQKRYKKELENHEDQVEKLLSLYKDHSKLTLIYAAKDEEHNNAVVLKDYLEEMSDE